MISNHCLKSVRAIIAERSLYRHTTHIQIQGESRKALRAGFFETAANT